MTMHRIHVDCVVGFDLNSDSGNTRLVCDDLQIPGPYGLGHQVPSILYG